jgi:hypothetical protein
MIFTQILIFTDVNGAGTGDKGELRRGVLGCSPIAELADDMPQRVRLPVKTDGAFTAPIWFESWESDAAAASIESATFDPPAPRALGRQRRRRLRTGGEAISAALAFGDAAASATTETPARRVIRSPRRVDCISRNSGVSNSQLVVSNHKLHYYEELSGETGRLLILENVSETTQWAMV